MVVLDGPVAADAAANPPHAAAAVDWRDRRTLTVS